MSRNYELLRQLDIETGRTDCYSLNAGNPVVNKKLLPVLSQHSSSVREEEILRLIQRIFLSASVNAPRQVVFFGVEDKNGSSSICAMAGRALAANSLRKVCLIDAHVRSPRLAEIFGVDGTNFFTHSSVPLRDQCVRIGSNLWLAESSMLADQSRVLLPPVELKERLTELRSGFDYVLIDAPGTSVCGDAQLLGILVDAAILVIQANRTRRLSARKSKDLLDAAGVRIIGTVLHNRSFPIPERLYKML